MGTQGPTGGQQGPGAELQQLLSQLMLSEPDNGCSNQTKADIKCGGESSTQEMSAARVKEDLGRDGPVACASGATDGNSSTTGVTAALQQLVAQRSRGLLRASSRPEAGRCLEAAAPLAAGTDVLSEAPVAFVVAKRHRNVRCGTCGRSVDAGAALPCAGCPLVRGCGRQGGLTPGEGRGSRPKARAQVGG